MRGSLRTRSRKRSASSSATSNGRSRSSDRSQRRRREIKQAVVRFYFDADILGLAKALSGLRTDITFPADPGGVVHKRYRPPCPITSAQTPDDEWIPVVARKGWLIVTRDSRIQHRRAEINAVRDYGARMVALASKDAGGVWGQLEVFMSQWRRIEQLVQRPGPFIVTISRTAATEITLS